MSQAGFELTGCVNSSQGGKQNLDNDKTRCTPVLGLVWQPNSDTLACNVNSTKTEIGNTMSKRQLLSIAQKTFDPIIFTGPVTLIAKGIEKL